MGTSKYRLRDSVRPVAEGLAILAIYAIAAHLYSARSAAESGTHNILVELWASLTFHVPVPVWVIAAITIALLPAARRSLRAGVWWPFLTTHEKDILRMLAFADGQALMVGGTATYLRRLKLEVKQTVARLCKRGLVSMVDMSADMFMLTPKGVSYVNARGYARAINF